MARGTLTIHSVTRALAPHLEWAASGVFGAPVRVKWLPQPIAPTLIRTQLTWHGPEGTGARLATALRGWDELRFEITQEPTARENGSRWMYTPSLGIHHSSMDLEGNVTLTEDRLRHCLAMGGASLDTVHAEIAKALGEPWDQELEAYRAAAADERPQRLALVG